MYLFFLFKQKTAYEMRISDWSSDVCSSDLRDCRTAQGGRARPSPGRNRSSHRMPQPPQHGRTDGRTLRQGCRQQPGRSLCHDRSRRFQDRKSVVKGKSVSVRVDLGGRRIIKKKKANKKI